MSDLAQSADQSSTLIAMPLALPTLSALILAGGASQRMGGIDKGLILFEDQPMIEHVLHRLPNQVDDRVISCNRNLDRYQQYGRIVRDHGDQSATSAQPFAHQGPMVGLIRGIAACKHQWIIVSACDQIYYPTEFAAAAWQALHTRRQRDPSQSPIVVAHDGQHQQNLCLLLHRSVVVHMADAFAHSPAVHRWLKQQKALTLHWRHTKHFTNINSPELLLTASLKP
jgi:molybdopterin-guanine dinucleotide biosynthesis protein A